MQLDKKEDASRVFHIDEDVFPFEASMPGRSYLCESYDDVAAMLTDSFAGMDMIQHFRNLTVNTGPKQWKPIGLESLANNPLVAFFLIDFSRAESPYIKGYLFDGELSEQPHIYYGLGQAFDTIRNVKAECEVDNYRALKQQAKQNNGGQ